MKAIACLLLCAVARLVIGQTTFNVIRQHPSTISYTGAISVFEETDGYIMFSFGWSLDSTVGALQIAKFDPEGNFLWEKEHRRNRNVFPGYNDPVVWLDDGRFVAAMDEYGGTEPNITFLYWFNSDGDTLRTHFLRGDSVFSDSSNSATRQLIGLMDGGFLHCGRCGGYPSAGTSCITRIDSSGNVLWTRNYPQADHIQNAVELSDGGFILGGSRPTDWNMAVVIRTDPDGNVQWIKYHSDYSITMAFQALPLGNGDLLIPGSLKTDPSWLVYDRWASLYHYAANGTLIERKDHNYGYNAEAWHILPKPGGYWMVGATWETPVTGNAVTTLWELDEDLDSLWMRRYYYYYDALTDNGESFIYSARNTSDGGLVMCGVSRQGIADPLPYLNSNWLIKLDSYGCLVPGCQNVGVQEYEIGLQEQLVLSPNPASDRLTFQLPLPMGFNIEGNAQALLLDAQGRVVLVRTVATSYGTISDALDVSGLPPGLYYLHLRDQRRWLAGGKVLCSP